MRYIFALVVSGVCWFCVAAVLGPAVPLLGEMWLQHLFSALVTALAVGFLFKKALTTWRGWRWYILPILTVLSASTIFGFSVELSWRLTEAIRGREHFGSERFYFLPAMFVLYSMTVYLLILFPLALLTQTLLRKVSRNAEHEIGSGIAMSGRY